MDIADSNTYAVIMAGGSGSRFWPLSRELTPKQILRITGHNSLLQETIDRLDGFIPSDRIYVVTNRKQVRILRQHLREQDETNIIIEPTPRNTSPCIGLAAINIRRIDPEGIMIVLPSDHLITDTVAFQSTIRKGIEIVRDKDPLVTIGMPPTRPETGYGYIQFDTDNAGLQDNVYKVKTFAEKPNRATAERFVKTGDFYWNSGIFIWSAKRILEEMEEHLPEQFEQLMLIDQARGRKDYDKYVASHYNRIKPISIDYGIMEVSPSPIYMIAAGFGWSDVGSWDEIYRILPKESNGNATEGESVTLDAKNNLIYSPGKLTAVIGLDNILVVNTKDATLICSTDRGQDVKVIVEKLRKDGRKEYL